MSGPPSFEFGRFRLDTAEHTLSCDGSRMALTPKVYNVLRLLVENAGHLVEKKRLLDEIWPDSFVEEGALTRSVSVLRKVLGETGSQKYIETVPKRGYRFVAAVTRMPSSAADPRRALATRAWHLPTIAATLVLLVIAGSLLGRLAQAPSTPLTAIHQQITTSGKDGGATLSSDGRQLAYVSATASEKRLIVQLVEDGYPVPVFAAPELGYLRWSPDGSQLLFWARGAGHDGIYTIELPGGVPRLIRRSPFVGCWSPDGKTIAAASYTGTIWLHDLAGNLLQSLTLQDAKWSIHDLDWSPARGLLFVSSDVHGAYSVSSMSPHGQEQRKLFNSAAEISAARWNEDGTAVYFLERSNQTASLKKWRPATGERVALLSGLEADRSFAMSRDGTRLAYARAPVHSNLWRLDIPPRGVEGVEPTALTSGTSLVDRPRISPDGTRVLFNRGHQPYTNLFTMPIGGGSIQQVTFLDSFNVGGVWSRDGSQVAFASTEDGTPRVWITATDGGTPRPLSKVTPGDSLDLAWSPGQRILFQQAGNRNYHTIDPDSRQEGLVATDGSVGWMFSPAYSPDGRFIAVSWNRKPDRGIWIVDAQDGTERLAHKAGAGTMVLGWSKDGNAIYAVESMNAVTRGPVVPRGETISDARVIEIPLNGAAPKSVTTLPGAEVGGVAMTPDARRFVYTVYSSRSDVWVVDNFDPAVKPASAANSKF